jgi:hypothetical protein
MRVKGPPAQDSIPPHPDVPPAMRAMNFVHANPNVFLGCHGWLRTPPLRVQDRPFNVPIQPDRALPGSDLPLWSSTVDLPRLN